MPCSAASMLFKLQDSVYLEVYTISIISYNYAKLHYLGWWRVSVWPRSPAGQALQRHFCLFAGIQYGLCGVWLRHHRLCAVCHLPPPLHPQRHPLGGAGTLRLPCAPPPRATRGLLGSARLVAANPVLKDFSLLLIAWPCCVWMVSPPALPRAWLIYFNITSSSLSFIFCFLTMFTLPSLALLWAEQPPLLRTPRAGRADLQTWQKSFPICSALNSSSCVTRNLNGTEIHRGPSSEAAMAQTLLQEWGKTFLSSFTTV